MSETPPRPRRSDETKATILAAAREQFAAHGYKSATIRGIAAAASIDPAMVMRYFGDKERLFAAAAELDLRLPDLRHLPSKDVGAALVAHFLDRWEEDESLKAILRTAATDEAIAARLRETFASQLLPLVVSVTGESVRMAAKRAGLVATQILGLALCRYVLALPNVVALEREELVRRIGPTLRAYLFED